MNAGEDAAKLQRGETAAVHTAGQLAKAWMPFALLSLFVLLWGLPTIKAAMGKATSTGVQDGWLSGALSAPGGISRATGGMEASRPRNAPSLDFRTFVGDGVRGCFLAAVLAGLFQIKPGHIFQIFGRTLYRLRFAVIAMACMLGLGYVTRYSGMDAVLGLAFTRTGWFFPFWPKDRHRTGSGAHGE